jgi:hypothetical protein
MRPVAAHPWIWINRGTDSIRLEVACRINARLDNRICAYLAQAVADEVLGH